MPIPKGAEHRVVEQPLNERGKTFLNPSSPPIGFGLLRRALGLNIPSLNMADHPTQQPKPTTPAQQPDPNKRLPLPHKEGLEDGTLGTPNETARWAAQGAKKEEKKEEKKQ